MGIMKYLIGGFAGVMLGFLYYKLVGCPSGSCPITSNPFTSSIYGGVMGLLIAGSL